MIPAPGSAGGERIHSVGVEYAWRVQPLVSIVDRLTAEKKRDSRFIRMADHVLLG